VYVTHDGGAHWQLRVDGLPNEPVNAVRQDPAVAKLLYAATENGVYVSFDGGARWQPLQQNLPHTSVRDLVVHDNDLAIATHGRVFWILDDVEPLRALARNPNLGAFHLFSPELAYRVHWNTNTDTPLPPEEPAGKNPPDGAIVDYALASSAQNVAISIYDSRGALVRKYSSDDAPPPPIPNLDKPASWERPFTRPSTVAGMHRFVWNFREPEPAAMAQDLPISAVAHDTPRPPQGVLVLPGRYLVRLSVDGKSVERPLTVALDPRVTISAEALRQQYELAHRIAALIDRSFEDAKKAKDAGRRAAANSFEDINGSLSALLSAVDDADAAPTAQASAAASELENRLKDAEKASR